MSRERDGFDRLIINLLIIFATVGGGLWLTNELVELIK